MKILVGLYALAWVSLIARAAFRIAHRNRRRREVRQALGRLIDEANATPNRLNWYLVDRYFAGEAGAAERELVERWLTQSPAFRLLVAEMHRGDLDEAAIREAHQDVQRRLERDVVTVVDPRD